MVSKNVSRFEIWRVKLDPAQGHEIKKQRPCVIISPNEMSPLHTAIVAPMTSRGVPFPTRIPCRFQGKRGLIILDQLRTVDKARLVQKMGVLSETTQKKLCDCLQEMFAY